MEKDIVNIGKSVVIKGELNGSEDLTIEGHVEGTIQLKEHVLTIGPNGRIKAQVFATVPERFTKIEFVSSEQDVAPARALAMPLSRPFSLKSGATSRRLYNVENCLNGYIGTE
jgi:hypothetical protein